MLYVVGLGLADERDITLKGLDAVKQCDVLYLEAYTSILLVEKSRLEELFEKPVIIADREFVESADQILDEAEQKTVGLLVVGDPFGATTHTDLVLRAKERKIPVQAIHNASIMNAIGCCGLQLYNYGQTISIVFFTDTWRPDSFYDKILDNKKLGLHTLCLLDIKVQEQSIENMARGRKIYEPPRFMTVAQAAQQLLEVEEKRNGHICRPTDIAVGLARVGSSTQVIQAGTLAELAVSDLGSPLHTLILPGTMHFLEADMLRSFAINGDTFNANAIISQH